MAVRRVSNEIPTMKDKDKNKMFTCPYNKYHRITALIYPGHVANCRKQYTGDSFARCPFNARHEFPACEYDYHVSTCPDKNIIEKELTTATAPNVPQVNHFPEWDEITPTEDWDIEANHVAFSIAGNANIEQERNAYDVMEDFQNELEERAFQQAQRNPPVFTGDMSGLSKAQKKNLKRAQKRREKRALENGHDGDEEEGDDDDDSEELTEQEKDYKLRQIAQNVANRQYAANAFVDWVSILNQYCQKNKINQPKYSEATNPHGGFGSAVVVTTERFFSDTYCKTKKDAKHSAARAALLGLNIAVSLPDPCRAPHVGGGNVERVRELEQRRAYIENRMTQSQQPRVIPGFNPTTSQASATQSSTQTAQITRQMGAVNLDRQNGDEWQVAGGRRRDAGRGSGRNSLRLAGIGRGRARK